MYNNPEQYDRFPMIGVAMWAIMRQCHGEDSDICRLRD
jgi:hypothetical protein